jgi:hypothetical protein
VISEDADVAGQAGRGLRPLDQRQIVVEADQIPTGSPSSATDPARLKGIAMINLDDAQDAIKELERAARLGLAGAMITEYPLERRRSDQPE